MSESNSTTLFLRQSNPEDSEKMANLQHPDTLAYGYLARSLADELGEFIALTVSAEGGDVTATRTGITQSKDGSRDANYVKFEVGNALKGLGLRHSVWTEALGVEVEYDEEGARITNAPISIGLSFASATEEQFEGSQEVDEDLASAILGGATADSDEADDSEDADEEAVEVTDEALGIASDD